MTNKIAARRRLGAPKSKAGFFLCWLAVVLYPSVHARRPYSDKSDLKVRGWLPIVASVLIVLAFVLLVIWTA